MGVGSSYAYMDTYICLVCGHFEERLPQDALAAVAQKIRSEWEKL
jgi:hypothetical protein